MQKESILNYIKFQKAGRKCFLHTNKRRKMRGKKDHIIRTNLATVRIRVVTYSALFILSRMK